MEIETCTPDRLPLRRLDWARLLPCLGEAREALGRYDEALKRTPPEILEILKWRECLSSLRGQSIQADLKEWLLFCIDGTGEESRTALLQKITHVFDALNAAIRLAKNEPFNGRIFSQIHAIVKQDAANPD